MGSLGPELSPLDSEHAPCWLPGSMEEDATLMLMHRGQELDWE